MVIGRRGPTELTIGYFVTLTPIFMTNIHNATPYYTPRVRDILKYISNDHSEYSFSC